MAELALEVEPPAEAGIVTEIAAPDRPDMPAASSGTADERVEVEQPVAEQEVAHRRSAEHMAAHCRDREFQIGRSTGSRRGRNDAGAHYAQF